MTDSLANTSSSPPVSLWDQFLQARTADVFCAAWLGLLCDKLPGVTGAAVLVHSADGASLVPLAVWPTRETDLAHLGKVVQLVATSRRGESLPTDQGMLLAYPVQTGSQLNAVLALDMRQPASQAPLVLRQVHWDAVWLTNLFAEHERTQAQQGRQQFQSVLETLALALRHEKQQQALFEVCNALRQQFACAHVALGWVQGHHPQVAALSETATFEKHGALASAYRAAMETTLDAGTAVYWLGEGTEPVLLPSVQLLPSLAGLLKQAGGQAVWSFPARVNGQTVAILTLVFDQLPASPALMANWVEAFLALFGPVLVQRREAERSSLARLSHEARQLAERFFGPRHLLWKTSAAAISLTVLVLLLVPIQYRVTAKTVIEGEVQRVVAAPFEGFIDASPVRAGFRVSKGQLLAHLDDRELRLEQAKWSSERDQYDRKLREAMANQDLTAVRVITAQLNQSQAQLDVTTEKIARATLLAPFDGVVVSGDWSQQIGTPVETGKKLFEVAPLNSYRVILKVDEREIRLVKNGRQGRLLISGLSGDPLDFTVLNVTPVATTEEGKNYFRVEAQLKQASLRLRPGMEGIGKIETESRSLWWALTHNLIDWLRLSLWNWTL